MNQSLDWFDLVLVFTTPCACGAGAAWLSGGVVWRLFWILERDLVTLAASGAGVVGCAAAGLLVGSAALAVLAANPAETSDKVARTASVRRIVWTPCMMGNVILPTQRRGQPELHRTP